MLRFKNVSFKYDDEDYNIIDNLSFHIQPGDFVSLIGISGCGKSTILRLTNHLLSPSSGEISIQANVGYMPQKDMLFPWRTIEKNLWLPMEIKKTPKHQMHQRALETLQEVGLSDYIHKYPKDLSGGMRQRVSFARTLLTDAKLLLLDEPFSALDALTRASMQDWLLEQQSRLKKTIVFINHDVEEACLLSNKILVVTDTPIRQLQEITIDQPYPRNREFLKSPDMLELKERLLHTLREQMLLHPQNVMGGVKR